MHIAKPIQSMVVIAAAALLLTTLPARGAVINEIEPNNSLGTAQNIDAFFTLDFSANIGNEMGNNTSETIPHVTILGTGNGTFDYFSFTVAVASLAILRYRLRPQLRGLDRHANRGLGLGGKRSRRK